MMEMGREHLVSQVENSDLNLYDVREWRTQKMMLRCIIDFKKPFHFQKHPTVFMLIWKTRIKMRIGMHYHTALR